MAKKSRKKGKILSPAEKRAYLARIARRVDQALASATITKAARSAPVRTPAQDVEAYRAGLVLDAGLSGDVTEQAWAHSIARTEALMVRKGAGYVQTAMP